MKDFILNGIAHGGVAATLLANGMDVGAMRPYIEKDGLTYVTLGKGDDAKAVCVGNSGTLTRESWVKLDEAVIGAARQRLRLVAAIRAKNLVYNVTEGMGKTMLQSQTMSDINRAAVNMEGVTEVMGDRPKFGLTHLPLPIISKEFHYSLREVLQSRNGGSPLDTTTAALAGRSVAEEIERLAIGSTVFSYGGANVYGITNFPSGDTQEITDPTDTGWTPGVFLDEILAARDKAFTARHYGPYVLFVSTDWEKYLAGDFSSAKGDITLRKRILGIEGESGVLDIVTCDLLPSGYTACLVQMTEDVIRMVDAMPITTLQWESHGGLMFHFKVMAIQVPQLRADINGRSGIVYMAPA